MKIPSWILSILGLGKFAGLIPVINAVIAAKNDDTPANREAIVQAAGTFIESEDSAISTEITDVETLDVAVENYIADKSTANIEIAATSFAKLVKDVAAPKITDEHFANIVNSIQAGLADEGVQ